MIILFSLGFNVVFRKRIDEVSDLQGQRAKIMRMD